MKTTYKHHIKNPSNQPFNVKPKKNLYKTRAWWQK